MGKSQWIGLDRQPADHSQPCPMLRRDFQVPGPITKARLHASACGLYEMYLNGRRVGDDHLTPGWTDYDQRRYYLTYDVTDQLVEGDNAIGAMLGDGWGAGRIGFKNSRHVWADQPSLWVQLVATLDDGNTFEVIGDQGWRATDDGPIRMADIYDGETYDARREMPGWAEPGFDDSAWRPADVLEQPEAKLEPRPSEPVRIARELAADQLTEPEPGRFVFDLGQNMVGLVRLTLSGKAGQTITLRYAEMLNEDGTVYTANLRSAKATDAYTFAKDGPVTWSPRFTFHGFRYVELTGVDEQPPLDAVTGLVLHNTMQPTGQFECSNALVNQLQSNIQWGQRGNFLEVPTDCPQRDERLGWTGDAQVFAPTACFNFNVADFFGKWFNDLADSQGPGGAIPKFAPCLHPPNDEDRGGPAWSDAAVICPYAVWQAYGDTRIIEQCWPMIRRFIADLDAQAVDGIRMHELHHHWQGFGDWLALDAPQSGGSIGTTPRDLIGTAYLAYVARLASQMAAAIARDDEAEQLAQLVERVTDAFNRQFVTKAGRIAGETQTSYLLALAFDLLPENMRETAMKHLVRKLANFRDHLATGFVGTPLLCPVLTRFGRLDLAYKLLLTEDYPSWLFTVKNGATTMWERWNSWTPDQGFGNVGMNSFNHYAYGAIGQWLYQDVAGIRPAEPGYRRIAIAPQIGPGLDWAGATLLSPHGTVSCRWLQRDDRLLIDITVPPNTQADVTLPADDLEAISESGSSLEQAKGISNAMIDQGRACFVAAAGQYRFECKHDNRPWA
jgi:alpha-L-rhamnosidase